jgi:hypothetical protein
MSSEPRKLHDTGPAIGSGSLWERMPTLDRAPDRQPKHDAERCAEPGPGGDDDRGCGCGCIHCVGTYHEATDRAIVFRYRCICRWCNEDCTHFRSGDVVLGAYETFALRAVTVL